MVKCEISVIMSIYNETLLEIEQSVESVLNQTYHNFECIIVIDNPKRQDAIEFLKKLQKKDKRIFIIENEANIGLAMSMNRAVKIASGIFLARMDADDICYESRLEKQYNYMVRFSCDLTCTYFDLIDEHGNVSNIKEKTYTDKDIKSSIPYVDPIKHPTVMMRKDSFLRVGGYRDFPCAQDYDLWLRMFANGYKMKIIKENLLHYRIRPNNISQSNSFKQIVTTWYVQKLYYERLKKGTDSFDKNNYEKFLNRKHIYDVRYIEKRKKDKKVKDKIDALREKNNKMERLGLMLKLFFFSEFYREYYLRLFINKMKIHIMT